MVFLDFYPMFNRSGELVEAGILAMWILLFGFYDVPAVCRPVRICRSGKIQICRILSIFRKVIIVIPLILILPTIFHLGTDGILMAEPISNFIGGTACFGTMLCTVWRELGKKEKSNAQET